ncbi:MAG: GGDEF domain-containing protein [Marinobacterium sp.]|nr:GGDEF domain-containing protein [Marinobacterium sp.]
MKAIDLQAQLINRMVTIWTFMAIAALGLTLARATESGLTLPNLLPGILACATLLLATFQNKLDTQHKAVALALISLAAGLSSIYRLGLLAPGTIFLPLSAITLAMVFSARVVTLFTGALLLLFGGLSSTFIFSNQPLPTPPGELLSSFTHWSLYALSLACVIAISCMLIIQYREQTARLVQELSAERDKLSQRAHYDELTGLPQARFCNNRLIRACHRAERKDLKVALLFVDLDDFKAVNDTWGHDAGDHCLQTAAQRMQDVCGKDHIVSRISGDEFLLILRNVENLAAVEALSARLVESISTPMSYEDGNFKVGISIGIVMFPDHTADPRRMRSLADHAMYDAKRGGKNTWAIYNPDTAQDIEQPSQAEAI